MKTLFFGAVPIGSVYAHLLHQAGNDVSVLARGERFDWLKENGLVLLNGITGQLDSSRVKVVSELKANDEYDLVVVAIRKNKLRPVFEILAASPAIKNVMFMGNNALGFDECVKHLPVGLELAHQAASGNSTIRRQCACHVKRDSLARLVAAAPPNSTGVAPLSEE